MKVKLINYGLDKDFYPIRKHYNDAGADVYSPCDITVPAGETVTFGLKFGLHIPNGFAVYTFTRSGMSTKGIMCQLSPVDSGYTGELHGIITNTSKVDYEIKKGDRITQIVMSPVVICDFVDEFEGEERGDGGLGSSGN